MFTYNSSFIGYPSSLRFSNFHGTTDSYENFMKSLRTNGPDWEFAKVKLNYSRNSLGHRSKELSDINLDNYILCAGCSVTEGIGVPVENRYSDILANLLNCDVYNLGLGSTGNDIIAYNLITWFSTVKQKPKLVVIQWSSNSRFSMHESSNQIVTCGPWDEKYNMLLTTSADYINSKTLWLKQMVRNTIDVPVIEIPWANDPEDIIQPKHSLIIAMDSYVDLARDNIHFGIKSNQNVANALVDCIQKVELL